MNRIEEYQNKWGTVFSSVQSLSRVRLFATPRIAARQASLSITNSRSSLKLTSIKSVMPSHPLASPSPPAPNPPSISLFQSQLFAWGDQSTGVSALASVLPNYLRKIFSVLYLILVYSAYHVTRIYHCLGKYILIYCHWWKFYLEGNCSLGICWIPQSSEEWYPN